MKHFGEMCSFTITSSFQNKLVTPVLTDAHQVKSLLYIRYPTYHINASCKAMRSTCMTSRGKKSSQQACFVLFLIKKMDGFLYSLAFFNALLPPNLQHYILPYIWHICDVTQHLTRWVVGFYPH